MALLKHYVTFEACCSSCCSRCTVAVVVVVLVSLVVAGTLLDVTTTLSVFTGTL